MSVWANGEHLRCWRQERRKLSWYLARAAGLDKAQMSRVVSSLIERGLVMREMSPDGGRAVALSLTLSGRKIYSGLIAEATERDRAFRAALEPGELAVLEAALEKLANQAQLFIKAEANEPNSRVSGQALDPCHDGIGHDGRRLG